MSYGAPGLLIHDHDAVFLPDSLFFVRRITPGIFCCNVFFLCVRVFVFFFPSVIPSYLIAPRISCDCNGYVLHVLFLFFRLLFPMSSRAEVAWRVEQERSFFAEMEGNIRRKIQQGLLFADAPSPQETKSRSAASSTRPLADAKFVKVGTK